MRKLRWFGIGLLIFIGVACLVELSIRFADGPWGFVAGGPLRAGELVQNPAEDWSFARDVEEVELALLDPARSRTTWILVHGRQLYVPCGFPSVKRWPHQALKDGRAVVRIRGKRYERILQRISEAGLVSELTEQMAEKYDMGDAAPDPEKLWFFRLDPRAEASPGDASARADPGR